MKISLITVVFNCVNTIEKTLETVQMQRLGDIEYIIIDGGSTDGTLDILRNLKMANLQLVSEPDDGLYDALNKGLSKVTGEIVGFIHADDFFADEFVLPDIQAQFMSKNADIVYGDLDYISRSDEAAIIRKWKSGPFARGKLKFGWMPPHPTVYVKSSLLGDNFFNLKYKISSDYDSILRLFNRDDVIVNYIPRVLVKMRVGGVSNKSISNIIQKTREDLLIARTNGFYSYVTILFKNLRKVGQFL